MRFTKTQIAFWASVAMVSGITAMGQLAVDTNSPTTNFGGSRPAGSGIKPSHPAEGGTAWMAKTNANAQSNDVAAVGGTGPGATPGSAGRATSASLSNLGWLGLLGLAGLLGLIWRQFEPPARE